jgi:hypothetical protein
MCGIAGFWDTTLTLAEKERTLAAMLETIGHRGSDYRGVRHYGDLSFGHNRLSIIDLLPEANQPMEKGGRACHRAMVKEFPASSRITEEVRMRTPSLFGGLSSLIIGSGNCN